MSSVQITLSTTSSGPNSLSSTFANNIGPDETLVYSGPLTLSTNSTSSNGTTADFDITIPLQTPFFYDPSKGNLLFDLKNPSAVSFLNVPFSRTLFQGYPVSYVEGFGSVSSPTGGRLDGSGFVTRFRFGPGATLRQLAAGRAKTLLTAPYGYDGKGYDFLVKRYVDAAGTPPTSFAGYDYYDSCQLLGFQTTTFAIGVDCSGLVMWSYNTAFGATTQFAMSTSGTNNNPVIYDKANAQYLYNTIDVSEADLKPGDLMFFDFDHDGTINHVAMYLGGDDVIQAPQCGELVKLSSKTALKQLSGFNACGPTKIAPCFRRVSSPIIKTQFVPRPDAPVSLAVTDPDGLKITANTIALTPRELLREVANVLYYNDADQVFSPVLKTGAYLVQAFPKPGTQPTDTFSLTATAAGITVTLAQDVRLADIPALGYGIISTGTVITPFIPIAIDIKPGSSTNPINPASGGTIPVAILSNASFNVPSAVDTSSLTFGRTGTEQSLAFCDGTGEDVNADGLLDLVCHFYTQKTNFQLGDTAGTLQGRTTSGQVIRGTDSVRIVP
jgi:cell wall-associated NlpC family hydrolase